MKNLLAAVAMASLLIGAISCRKDPGPEEPERYDRVMILASLGFNSLSGDLKLDIKDILGEEPNEMLPLKGTGDVLLILEHTKSGSSYSNATSPIVYRIKRDSDGKTLMDTIMVLDKGAKLTDKDVMKKALDGIKDKYPSDHYGMVMSSHGTGWLPEGYYRKTPTINQAAPTSFGDEVRVDKSGEKHYEMDIRDLEYAIPMHLDYLLFDACLMGGVEVAYELREKTSYIGFSATEILSEGFNYKKIVSRLLGKTTDPEAVCRDYFEQYKGSSATIAYVDCSKLDALGVLCKELFKKYRSGLNKVDPSSVQGFFRVNRHYFYDMKDILDKSGISAADESALDEAINACVLYKEATDSFLDLKIATYCGLSMYLPANGTDELDKYYPGLAWNKVTGLVE